MPDKIPIAESFQKNNFDGLRDALNGDDLYFFYKGVISEYAKKYATLLLEAHKEAIKEGAKTKGVLNKSNWNPDQWYNDYVVDKESIETAHRKFLKDNNL